MAYEEVHSRDDHRELTLLRVDEEARTRNEERNREEGEGKEQKTPATERIDRKAGSRNFGVSVSAEDKEVGSSSHKAGSAKTQLKRVCCESASFCRRLRANEQTHLRSPYPKLPRSDLIVDAPVLPVEVQCQSARAANVAKWETD